MCVWSKRFSSKHRKRVLNACVKLELTGADRIGRSVDSEKCNFLKGSKYMSVADTVEYVCLGHLDLERLLPLRWDYRNIMNVQEAPPWFSSKQDQTKTFKHTDPATNSFQLDPPLPLSQLLRKTKVLTNKRSSSKFLVLPTCIPSEFPSAWLKQIPGPDLTLWQKHAVNRFFRSQIMTSTKDDNPDLSPTSPGDDSDAILSPTMETEPVPGLNGVPVRCTWHVQ